jgi:Holliday junction DNA helicase RuvB
MVHRLDFYNIQDLEFIIRRSSEFSGRPSRRRVAMKLQTMPRNSARANRLLKRIRDYAQVKGDGKITVEMARSALKLMDIDEQGSMKSTASCCARHRAI